MNTEQDPPKDAVLESPSADEKPATHTPSRKRPGVPSWTLGVLILALTGVLIWAGDALIRSRQRLPESARPDIATVQPTETSTSTNSEPSPTPPPATGTPAATPTLVPLPATPDAEEQAVILVAEFESRAGSRAPATDAAQGLYEALLAHTEQARVERLAQIVTEETTDATLQEHHAAYVVWGYQNAQGTSAYIRRTRPTLPISLSTQARILALSEPVQIDLCALEDADLAADLILGMVGYRQGKDRQASSALQNALSAAKRQSPGCKSLQAHIHLYLGNLAAQAGEYEAALVDYRAGLDLAGRAEDQALFYTNQASIYYGQDNQQAALSAARMALEQDPEQANAYYHRANAYRALDQIEDAQNDLDQALALDPTHARAYASRGLLYHNADAFEDALQDYTDALELDPWAADVYLNRGGTYATLGELDLALQDYSQALSLQPDDPDAFYNRGTVYAIQQRYPEALQDLNRALELEPDFSQVYGNRGLIYKALGEPDAAIADLEKFLELSDNAQWRAMIEQHLAELKLQQE